MKKYVFYSLLAFALLLLVLNIVLTARQSDVVYRQKIPADITIDQSRLAFKLTNDSILHFGSIRPNMASDRSFTLKNTFKKPVKVEISKEGNDWISFSDNNFVLNPTELRNITATITANSSANLGNYSWNITVLFLSVK